MPATTSSERTIAALRRCALRLAAVGLVVASISCERAPTTRAPEVEALRIAAGADAGPDGGSPGADVHEEDGITAARLRAVKGRAIYRVLGPAPHVPGAIEEIVPAALPGRPALVTVAGVEPASASLALLTGPTDGLSSTSRGRLGGGARPVRAPEWIVREPFPFGGAAWDEEGGVVAYVAIELGPRLATRRRPSGETVEKLAFEGAALFVVRRQQGRWAAPELVARAGFGAPRRGPVVHRDAALWPAAIEADAVAGGTRIRLQYLVDGLIEPLYAGPDRDPRDGRYAVVLLARTEGGLAVTSPPARVGDFDPLWNVEARPVEPGPAP